MEGGEGSIVARLDPASEVKQGEEAELWVDASKLQLFDPEDGRNLMVDERCPAGRGRGSGCATQPATELRSSRRRRPDHRVVVLTGVLEVPADRVDDRRRPTRACAGSCSAARATCM